MALTAKIVVMSILVLNLHHCSSDRPIPGWLKTLVFSFLSRLVCYEKTRISPSTIRTQTYINSVEPRKETNKTMKATDQQLEEMETKQKQHLNKHDWQEVAKVVDRFFLFVSLAGVICSPIFLFVVLQSGSG